MTRGRLRVNQAYFEERRVRGRDMGEFTMTAVQYLGTLLANNGSAEAQADLAAALLDALAIDTVTVVGNSAGDRCSAICATSPGSSKSSHSSI